MTYFMRFWSKIVHKAEIHTIRTKLIISFLLIALIPLTIMSIFSYNSYHVSMTEKISEYSQNVINSMARDLNEYFLDIEVLLTKNQDFYIDQFIKLMQGEDFNNRKYAFRLWEDFNNLTRAKPGIEEIGLVFSDGRRLGSTGLYTMDYSDFYNKVQASMLPSGVAIFGPNTSFLNKAVITMARSYPSPDAEKKVFLVADINLERLALITDVKLGATGYIFLADEQGRIIYHPKVNKIGSISPFYNKGNSRGFQNGKMDDLFLTTSFSEVTGWNIISVVDAGEFLSELATIRKLTLIVVGLILLAVISLSLYLSHALSRPIKELQSLTKRAANNELSIYIESKGKDEIAQLGNSFNKMIARIRKLMSENVKEQKMLRKLEMESLNKQIKPHFIYNTLDLIIGQLESNNTSKASYLIEALGRFFRLSLSGGREIVPIANEIDHVRNYLFIQQLRHGEEYEYEIIIEDQEIKSFFIPRLLLQPLVENAIDHGVLHRKAGGKITLTAYRSGRDVIFKIQDNGPGIEKEKLREINGILRGTSDLKNEKEYFGLRNVNRRAQLVFGENYGVFLKNNEEQGAQAILKIKILEEPA